MTKNGMPNPLACVYVEILVIPCLAPITRATINDATVELANLLRQYCGGEIVYKYLNPENQIIEI
ncbi:MAG: hypothetical protein K8R25_02945 [Methanosarcinales archaeon]|nr:hypothetical protein [Methanosarcinales archaeon]